MSTTTQQFQRNETNQTLNIFNNLERAKTAKGLAQNEEEMRKTRVLMDKITGKASLEARNLARPETGASRAPLVS